VRTAAAQNGQASPEYLGLVLLVALVAAALAAVNLCPGIADATQDAFCRAVGAGCGVDVAVAQTPTEEELLDAALEVSLDEFLAVKDSPDHDPRMDYSDDGCSAPVIGSEGFWFHFREACERHDFGYRNSKRLGIFDTYKDRIDLVFIDDMLAACTEEAWWQRRPCRWMAGVYFGAVSIGGGHCELPGDLPGRVPGPCAPEHG
jgi:Prokaryotic phospholipase A2